MNPRSAIALFLSLAGAALDFASASLVTMSNPGLLSWTMGLYVFGAVIAATGVLGTRPAGMKRMRIFGGLMFAYGVAMFVIGYSMYFVRMMDWGTLSGLGMFLIGFSMIASGSLMSFNTVRETDMMQPRDRIGTDTYVLSLVLVGLLGFGLGFYFESTVTHNLVGTMPSSGQQMGAR